jgi:hypothetical protein
METHMARHMNAHMGDFIKLQTKKRIFLTAFWILNNVLLTFILFLIFHAVTLRLSAVHILPPDV